MIQKRNAPGRGDGARAENKAFRPDHSSVFEAAGTTSSYYLALTDSERRVLRRLSGIFSTESEACRCLAWVTQRHPTARIVREVMMREVMA